MHQIDADRPLRSPQPGARSELGMERPRRSAHQKRHRDQPSPSRTADHAAVWQWIEQGIAASEQVSLTV